MDKAMQDTEISKLLRKMAEINNMAVDLRERMEKKRAALLDNHPEKATDKDLRGVPNGQIRELQQVVDATGATINGCLVIMSELESL